MERVNLAWTAENWITVVLMAALGYLLFSLVWQLFNRAANDNSAAGNVFSWIIPRRAA